MQDNLIQDTIDILDEAVNNIPTEFDKKLIPNFDSFIETIDELLDSGILSESLTKALDKMRDSLDEFKDDLESHLDNFPDTQDTINKLSDLRSRFEWLKVGVEK